MHCTTALHFYRPTHTSKFEYIDFTYSPFISLNLIAIFGQHKHLANNTQINFHAKTFTLFRKNLDFHDSITFVNHNGKNGLQCELLSRSFIFITFYLTMLFPIEKEENYCDLPQD